MLIYMDGYSRIIVNLKLDDHYLVRKEKNLFCIDCDSSSCFFWFSLFILYSLALWLMNTSFSLLLSFKT